MRRTTAAAPPAAIRSGVMDDETRASTGEARDDGSADLAAGAGDEVRDRA